MQSGARGKGQLLAVISITFVLAQIVTAPHDPVVPYVIVVLCIALGMIVLCRSANRSTDVKLEDLDEE